MLLALHNLNLIKVKTKKKKLTVQNFHFWCIYFNSQCNDKAKSLN